MDKQQLFESMVRDMRVLNEATTNVPVPRGAYDNDKVRAELESEFFITFNARRPKYLANGAVRDSVLKKALDIAAPGVVDQAIEDVYTIYKKKAALLQVDRDAMDHIRQMLRRIAEEGSTAFFYTLFPLKERTLILDMLKSAARKLATELPQTEDELTRIETERREDEERKKPASGGSAYNYMSVHDAEDY